MSLPFLYLCIRRMVFSVSPQAAVDVAIKELCKERHNGVMYLYVFIVPHRWTSLWRRNLYKACDLRFENPKRSVKEVFCRDKRNMNN